MSDAEDQPWRARIRRPDGRVVGAGFLIDGRQVLTCAHVVADALGVSASGPRPQGRVLVDFPVAGTAAPIPAWVAEDGWTPVGADDRGDVAVLVLQGDSPAEVKPAPLRQPSRLIGRQISTFGYPPKIEYGEWAHGTVSGPGGPGGQWVQLDAATVTGRRIEGGFSGAAVYDHQAGGVVGMVVAEDTQAEAKIAWMLPTKILTDAWPPLRQIVRSWTLYGGDLASHWSPRSRGVERDAYPGWYFTGRHQVLTELAGWLANDLADGRVRVVTGGPGSGKSAVLARLVTTSDPIYRQRIPNLDPTDPTIPPSGGIDIAVHGRGKTIDDVVGALAQAAAVEADSPDALIDALLERDRPCTVVVDALDESVEPTGIAGRLLRPLAADVARAGVRVLVGTRPGREDELVHALGSGAVRLDLDQPPYLQRSDLVEFVHRRLLVADDPTAPTPYRNQDRLAGVVADAVAARAYPTFLIAQLTSKSLVQASGVVDIEAPDWDQAFPDTVADAMDHYVNRLTEGAVNEQTRRAQQRRLRELLTPLAYAEGEGLPQELWAAVASALAHRPYSLDDVQGLLDTAADDLIEHAQADGGPVYRLYHQALADTMRRPHDTQANQRHLLAALTRTIPTNPDGEPEWSKAHTYICAHLAVHAAHAGQLDPLLADPTFILHANLDRLLRVLRHATTSVGSTTAGTIERASHHLRGRPLEERAAYLQLVARQHGDTALTEAVEHTGLALAWRTPWAFWRTQAPYRVMGHHPKLSQGTFVATTLPDGQAMAITGGGDGTIRLWDLATGTPRTDLLPAHQPGGDVGGGVQQLVTTTLPDGQPIAITGGGDGTIRLWDLQAGTPRTDNLPAHQPADPLGGVEQLVTTTLPDGQPIAISGGGDGTIRLWDLQTGTPRTDPLPAHQPGFYAVEQLAVAILPGGQAIAISGGGDGTLQLWDLTTGTARTDPLPAHQPVGAVPSGVQQLVTTTLPDGQPIAITGGRDGTLRLWDLVAGTPRTDLLPAHQPGGDVGGGVQQLVTTTLPDGQPIAITGGGDGTIRLWDLQAGTPRTDNLPAHQPADPLGGVEQLVTTTLPDGQPIAISGGGDGTIRLWDLQTGTPRTEPLPAHQPSPYRGGGVEHLVVTALPDGQPIAITAGLDGTIRLWDLHTATPRTEPLPAHDPASGGVQQLAVTTLPDGQAIAITAGYDGTIRLWNLEQAIEVANNLPAHESSDPFGGMQQQATTTLPDGQPIAITAGNDGTIRLWDLQTGTPRTNNLLAHEPTGPFGGVHHLATTTLADGHPIAITTGGDGTIRLWDLQTGTPRTDPLPAHQPGPRGGGGVQQLAVTTLPDGQAIAITAGHDATIRLWDLQTGTPRTNNLPTYELGPYRGGVQQLVTTSLPDGQAIAITAGYDGDIRLWDLQTGTPRTDPLPAHQSGPRGGGGVQQLTVTTLPDGQPIAITGGRDGTIRLWDLTTLARGSRWWDGWRRQRRPGTGWPGSRTPYTDPLPAHDGEVEQLATTSLPNGQAIAITTGGGDGTIRLWDLLTGTPYTDPLPAHDPASGGVQQLATTSLPDGQAIAITAGGDGTIRLWDLLTGTPYTDPLPAHDGEVKQLVVTSQPDGQAIAISGGGDRVCTYDLAAGQIWRQISVGSRVQAIALLPDGLVVVGTEMGLLGLRDVLPRK